MDRDAELLKEKALLLLNRERELWLLRRKHARVSAWLSVAHSIPEVVAPGIDPLSVFDRLAHKLLSLLELQKVGFYRVNEQGKVSPLVERPAMDDGAGRTLPEEALALLARDPAGACDEPVDAALAGLARAVGLHRFMWYQVADSAPGGGSLLMVAGYDEEKASFYERFDEGEVGQWRSMGRNLGLQLRNASLVSNLENERESLARLNETLERRVAERTMEIASTNRELARALRTLEEKDRHLTEDLEQARSFQQSILPLPPVSARAEFGLVYQPLQSVGGDIFDISEIAPGHFRLFVADATGHGVQASMRTIVLKSEYDRLKAHQPTPQSLLDALNRALLEQLEPAEMLCTGCCFDLVLGTDQRGELRYASAAHPPLVHLRDGVAHEIYRDGPFLGLSSDVPFSGGAVPIGPGDAVFAYTDGLCDQINEARRPFPLERALEATVGRGQPLPAAVDEVMRAFDTFRAGSPTVDDITLVGVRISPPR
jgi:serine phosphatase RsbU (regulator of sigma subunit)